jgi:hypothetical protein
VPYFLDNPQVLNPGHLDVVDAHIHERPFQERFSLLEAYPVDNAKAFGGD